MKKFYTSLSALAFLSFSLFASADNHTVYSVNSEKTKLEWIGIKSAGKKELGRHNGFIKVNAGELHIKKGNLVNANFTVDMNSITVADIKDASSNEKLKKHLMNEDFFNVTKFPTSTFKLTKAKTLKKDKNGFTHKLTGELTMLGKTKKLSFPAKVTMDANSFHATAAIEVNRLAYGMNFMSKGLLKRVLGKAKNKVINKNILFNLDLHAQTASASKLTR